MEQLFVTAKSCEMPGGWNPWPGENLKVEEEGGQKELMLLCRGNCRIFQAASVILWVGAIKSKRSKN